MSNRSDETERHGDFVKSLVAFTQQHRAANWSGTFADFIEQVVQAVGGIGAQPRDVVELSAHGAEQLEIQRAAKLRCASCAGAVSLSRSVRLRRSGRGSGSNANSAPRLKSDDTATTPRPIGSINSPKPSGAASLCSAAFSRWRSPSSFESNL